MSHRTSDDEFADYGSPLDAPAAATPAPVQAPPVPAPPLQPSTPRGDPLRSSLLKKPLDAGLAIGAGEPAAAIRRRGRR